MALTPVDDIHALQIQAGTLGRKAGHAFEDTMTAEINGLRYPMNVAARQARHVASGDPALLLIGYIAAYYKQRVILSATAISTGALATSEEGQKWLSINGADVRRCKSDLVITLGFEDNKSIAVGVSTKQCNNSTPTNAQLYFTTARGFTKLLRDNKVEISDGAVIGLRKFCGDEGYRPLDEPAKLKGRKIDPRRFFLGGDWRSSPQRMGECAREAAR